jgi:hypothetical protein
MVLPTPSRSMRIAEHVHGQFRDGRQDITRRERHGGRGLGDGQHAHPIAIDNYVAVARGDWEANPWCWAITFKRVTP